MIADAACTHATTPACETSDDSVRALSSRPDWTRPSTRRFSKVKSAPTDVDARLLLCDLLCFANQLERADRQLDVLVQQDSESGRRESAFTGSSFARRWPDERSSKSGRAARVHGTMSPDVLKLHLRALIALREGAASEAGELAAARPSSSVRPCTVNVMAQSFEDLRDLDDLTASFLEVLTSTGKYYWVGWERIESLEFRPPKHLRDLLWRPAEMVVRGGPEALVYVPGAVSGIAPQRGSENCARPQDRLGRDPRSDRPSAVANGRFSSVRRTSRSCRFRRLRFPDGSARRLTG